MDKLKRKETMKLVWTNIRVMLVLLLVLEIIGQFVFLFKHGQFRLFAKPFPENYHHGQIFEPHPYLAGRLQPGKTHYFGTKKLTATASRRRWTGADEQDTSLFRIACVGGSTTFCVHLTDSDSWPAMLQQKLGKKYAVFNYGLIGYSTAEAIIQTALQLPDIRPDLIIYYEGWNDIRNYHDPDPSADYYNHGMMQIRNFDCDEDELKCRNVFDAFQKFSGMAYLAEISRNVMVNYFRTHGILKPKINFVQPAKIFTTPDPYVDHLYYRNLKTLRTLALSQGAIPMFIPQLMDYSRFINKKNTSGAWTPYIENSSFPALMDHFNALMDSVNALGNCAEIKNSMDQHEWKTDCFVDDGHFSRKGSDQFSNIIYHTILKIQQDNHAIH